MHTKVINPQTHGKDVYQNTGSTARTLNYLVQESKGKGEEVAFFGAEKDGLTAEQVRASIDQNVKGLRDDEVKFYSLVLSPSADELARIGNDEGKLTAFTREAMEQYAGNFHLKGGRELTSSDLVWAATIHQQRSYRGDDPAVQAGEKQAGEKKEGFQTHVHIIVSARDAEQKITLNPQGQKRRFNMQEWQGQVQDLFDTSFGKGAERATRTPPPARPLSPEQQAKRETKVRERVSHINGQVGPNYRLEADRTVAVAEQRNYDKGFYRNLSYVARRAEEGRPVDNPHKYLETGLVEKPVVASRQLRAVLQAVKSASGDIPERSHVQEIGEERTRNQRGY